MEKFWWFLIVITGFALASFLIYRAVVEWEDHPILTTVDSSSVPITSIQFPTITICPKRRVVYRQMQSSLLYNPWNMIENLFNQFNLTNFNGDPEEIRFMNDTSFLLDVVISSIQRTLTQNIKFDFEQLKIKWADELDSDYYREVRPSSRILLSFDYEYEEEFSYSDFNDTAELLQNNTMHLKIEIYQMMIDIENSPQNATSPRAFILNDIKSHFGKCHGQLEFHTSYLPRWHEILSERYAELEEAEKRTSCTSIRCKTGMKRFHGLLEMGDFLCKNRPPRLGSLLAKFRKEIIKHFLYSEKRYNRIREFFANVIKNLIGPLYGLEKFNLLDVGLNGFRTESNATFVECRHDLFLRHRRMWLSYLKGNSSILPCLGSEDPCCSYSGFYRLGRTAGNSSILPCLGSEDPCCSYSGFYTKHKNVFGRILLQMLDSLVSDYPEMPNGNRLGYDIPTDYRHKRMPKILRCNLGSFGQVVYAEPTEDCTLMEPTSTLNGICVTFNQKNAFDNLKKEEERTQNIPEKLYEILTNNQRNKVFNPRGHGLDFGFQLLIYDHDLLEREDKDSEYTIGITDQYNYMNPRLSEFKTTPGMHTYVSITPQETVTHPNVVEYPQTARGCRFPHENEGLHIYKVYSKAACQYECVIYRGVQRFGCVPWNYLSNVTDKNICDDEATRYFNFFLQNTSFIQEHCDCPQDCHQLEFTYSETIKPVDFKSLCKIEPGTEEESDLYWSFPQILRRYENVFMGKLRAIRDGKEYTEYEECIALWSKEMTLVEFKLDSPTFTRMTKEAKTTFIDKVATIGGTLGLFTGMSIISMFEICYWGMKASRKLIMKNTLVNNVPLNLWKKPSSSSSLTAISPSPFASTKVPEPQI
ncbi:hypothetical protein TCAL_05533 [Tigriopus californicus]|uniref:Uncharacterized protein n=2 Tax=Tigriopus californicus TaxID=6832 RepID=A0A553P8I8_TIGCA|nr:hypothetical protein TCAL_05533 [Tigriopus californicus]|eukprot:TCALIF_05533-PA protein Name:"Protein of unknown function" AED:0.29 eAED:0.13 QI:25/0.5/0.2/0.8/0.75/0.6/5/117/868